MRLRNLIKKKEINTLKEKYEIKYRLIKFGIHWVLYQWNDGLIFEKIKYEKNPAIYEHHALQRLYKINKISLEINNEIKQEIDLTN